MRTNIKLALTALALLSLTIQKRHCNLMNMLLG